MSGPSLAETFCSSSVKPIPGARTDGLLKLGWVRVSALPLPLRNGHEVRQTLRLQQGEINVLHGTEERQVKLRIWVDANHPVVRVEARGEDALRLSVALETWRDEERNVTTEISDLFHRLRHDTDGPDPYAGRAYPDLGVMNLRGPSDPYPTISDADVVVEGLHSRILWYHHNRRSAWTATMKHQSLGGYMDRMEAPLLGRIFGGAILGKRLVSVDERVLESR